MAVRKWFMPAEWAYHTGCWMLTPYRSDNWRLDAKPAQNAFLNVALAIAQFERVNLGVHPSIAESFRTVIAESGLDIAANFGIELFEVEYDDSWMRDVGPTILINRPGVSSTAQVISPELESTTNKLQTSTAPLIGMDWIFNAWGGLYDDFKHDDLVASAVIDRINASAKDNQHMDRIKADFVLEGGSIHVDGEGTVLVTEECLLNENRNPNLSKTQIEERLRLCLGVDTVVWIPKGLAADEDTNGHIDNIACFAKPGVVLLSWSDDISDVMYAICREAYEILTHSVDAQGRTLTVVKLPLPEPMYYTAEECGGETAVAGGYAREVNSRMAGSYINFYIANGGIVLPGFGQPDADARAVQVLDEVFNGGNEEQTYKIVQVAGCREILLGGGNIHCITQQQAARTAGLTQYL